MQIGARGIEFRDSDIRRRSRCIVAKISLIGSQCIRISRAKRNTTAIKIAVGIVGTRTASRYGVENSYKIAYSLSKYNVPIISGGALGVDCASHRGALAADGVSVCVRGCGINCSYLRENADMRRAITKRGAVISEYPPDEQPRSYYFPARNRIIAALSDGVVIIESGIRSGSLITADLALEMGK